MKNYQKPFDLKRLTHYQILSYTILVSFFVLKKSCFSAYSTVILLLRLKQSIFYIINKNVHLINLKQIKKHTILIMLSYFI